ncbi:MAG: hypothetical protein EXR27_14895 [Betaproteobacteria bacterium]|nr:hypothetical protein [Betaproteobacteria bacterium]
MAGTTTYKAALNQALTEGMSEFPKSFLMGQDVGAFSIGGVTAGLQERFGAARIRNSPISESAMVGMAVGATMKGYVCVIELAYADISAVAFSSIVHSAAKLHFATNGRLRCSLVIRSPIGRWSRHGAMGTDVTLSWFNNVPDLAICMPATPQEAYWHLRAAFRRPVPTLFLEDRSLMADEGEIGGELDERARVLKPGRDLTIVAAGRCVKVVLAAVDQLEKEGVKGALQVLSLGHIKPFDRGTLLDAARATRRVLVVQDEPPFGGYGPMVQSALDDLPVDALLRSPKLLSRADTFLPFLREEDHLPTAQQVVEAARKLLN